MRANGRMAMAVAMTLSVTIATVATGRAAAQSASLSPSPPPTDLATVASDGRTIPIASAHERGTDGAFGADAPAVPATPVGVERIGPLALASAETILGTDNRSRVSNTTNKPARMVVLLTYGGNQWCSGFLVGPCA